jgi:hypothetical protein
LPRQGQTQRNDLGGALELTGPDLGGVVSDLTAKEISISREQESKLKRVIHHLLNSLLNTPPGLPAEDLLSPGGVGPSLLGVVTGKVLVNNLDPPLEGTLLLLDFLDNVPDSLGELEDGELVRATDVDLQMA